MRDFASVCGNVATASDLTRERVEKIHRCHFLEWCAVPLLLLHTSLRPFIASLVQSVVDGKGDCKSPRTPRVWDLDGLAFK